MLRPWIGVMGVSRCNALGLMCQAAACKGVQPRCLRYRCYQATSDVPKQFALGKARRQVNADARDVLNDASSDFEEPLPDRGKLGPRERIGFWNGRPDRMHQPEGG